MPVKAYYAPGKARLRHCLNKALLQVLMCLIFHMNVSHKNALEAKALKA